MTVETWTHRGEKNVSIPYPWCFRKHRPDVSVSVKHSLQHMIQFDTANVEILTIKNNYHKRTILHMLCIEKYSKTINNRWTIQHLIHIYNNLININWGKNDGNFLVLECSLWKNEIFSIVCLRKTFFLYTFFSLTTFIYKLTIVTVWYLFNFYS